MKEYFSKKTRLRERGDNGTRVPKCNFVENWKDGGSNSY